MAMTEAVAWSQRTVDEIVAPASTAAISRDRVKGKIFLGAARIAPRRAGHRFDPPGDHRGANASGRTGATSKPISRATAHMMSRAVAWRSSESP